MAQYLDNMEICVCQRAERFKIFNYVVHVLSNYNDMKLNYVQIY